MSNVSLMIGGRSFTVACAAGEEAHVRDLGRLIDSKISTMGDVAGQSESRILLFATLLLADELHDVRNAPPAPSSPELPADFDNKLHSIADRLENLALRLESDGTSA
jgi:cell division protein ZapA